MRSTSRQPQSAAAKLSSGVISSQSQEYIARCELYLHVLEQIAQMLVAKEARSIINGKLHDVDYWCEKCQLAATEPGICKCCGSPVELRELPVETQ